MVVVGFFFSIFLVNLGWLVDGVGSVSVDLFGVL
jgi:hypothetical protein